MALQAGVSSSKVLILVGAGVTGSIVLRNGHLSDIILQIQELLRNVNNAELSNNKYDTALIAAQIRQLAQEIRELAVTGPVTIFNGNSSSSGSYASYILPAAAVGAMGYCYMWWKGWSLSDVMFVTKHNMANAVATVSKQLEHVHEAVASTKRHLSKRIEGLDWKLEEHKEITHLIANDVNEVKSSLSQIGFHVEEIHQMVAGLEGQIELLESKQDMTNSGLWHLCQAAEGFKDGLDTKPSKDISSKLVNHSAIKFEDKSLKGLQFITKSKESISKAVVASEDELGIVLEENVKKAQQTRIHRSYPVGISLTRNILGSGLKF